MEDNFRFNYKHCVMCGELISNGDVYHDMSVKYCDNCRADAYRKKDAARHRQYRKRTRDKFKKTEELNAALRAQIEAEQERTNQLLLQIQILREQNIRLAAE